jgi:glycosyltransferase involved in cell wall biosynthesis
MTIGMGSGATVSEAPAISVLLPVHNAEHYLRAAVDSVLKQTFSDFELLALDDGSTDRSLSILREYAAKDSRVRILSRENQGVVATLNELITASRGLYLARMDADDICRPRRFEKQIAYLEEHPECVVIGSRVLLIDPEGMPIIESLNESTHDEIDATVLSARGGLCGMTHPTVIMRREAVVKIGKYHKEAEFAEDIDLFLRLAEIGKLANLPEVLLEHRRHLTAIGYANWDRQLAAVSQIVKRARKRRGLVVATEVIESASEPQTVDGVHRTWAWWALSAGNGETARKHALRALIKNPFNIENVRVAACAIRGF